MPTPFANDGVHQHIDGGFYRALGIAKPASFPGEGVMLRTGLPRGARLVAKVQHSEDQSTVLVYETPGQDGWTYRFERPSALYELGDLMVYEHVWPFETSLWGRPVQQFEQRFTPVPHADLMQAMEHDRVTAQATITAARSARRRQQPTPQAVDAAPGKIEAMLRTTDDPLAPGR